MATVRVDDNLLEKLKVWINKNGNKYKYPSVTAFINNAIYEKLKSVEERKK